MAKEFKHFDKVYAKLQNTFMEGEENLEAVMLRSRDITGWDYVSEIEVWANKEIADAVYARSGYTFAGLCDWQMFRVSLKGQTSQVKLARLEFRYLKIRDKVRNAVALGDRLLEGQLTMHTALSQLDEAVVLEKCRIDNYLGALRRGGQLDSEYKIRK